jgi:hypothetical protein
VDHPKDCLSISLPTRVIDDRLMLKRDGDHERLRETFRSIDLGEMLNQSAERPWPAPT